jgi:hypothetical protein
MHQHSAPPSGKNSTRPDFARERAHQLLAVFRASNRPGVLCRNVRGPFTVKVCTHKLQENAMSARKKLVHALTFEEAQHLAPWAVTMVWDAVENGFWAWEDPREARRDLIDLGAVNWRLEFVDFAAAGESILTLGRRLRARDASASPAGSRSAPRPASFSAAAQASAAAHQEAQACAGRRGGQSSGGASARASARAGAASKVAPKVPSKEAPAQAAAQTRCSSKELLARAPTETYRQYWTAQEDSRLIQLKAAGKTLAEIAKVLKRTPRAVGSRWERLQATPSMRLVFHA